MVSVSANNLVKSITPNMKVSYEGGVFRIRVNLSRRYSGRIPVSLTGSSPDTVGRRNWTLPNGVRWSADGSALILSKSMTAFVLLLPVKNDALKENLERVRLTIGGKAVDLSIKDVPVAHVKETYSSLSRLEGLSFTMPVTLTRRSFYTSLPVALTGATDSVAARSRWTFSHGVKWNYNYSHLLIPPNVERFNVTIGSKIDFDRTPETLRLTLGNRVTNLQVQQRWYRAIVYIGAMRVVRGYSSGRGDLVREGSTIEFDVHIERPGTYLRVDFSGQAFRKFKWKIISARSDRYGILKHLGQGLFMAPGVYRERITIRAEILADRVFSGRLVGSISAMPDNPLGPRSGSFTVEDGHPYVNWAFKNLFDFYQRGFFRTITEIKQQFLDIKTIENIKILDSEISQYKYLIDSGLHSFFKKEKQSVRAFLTQVAEGTEFIRDKRMVSAQTQLAFAYSDLVAPSFVGGAFRDTVLNNTVVYLNQMNEALSNSLKKAMSVRTIFADLLGSADPNNEKDIIWIKQGHAKDIRTISELWADYETRFDQFVNNVSTTFDQIRVAYSEARDRTAELIMNIVSAVLTGVAVLGSIGFFVANFRAAWNQVNAFMSNTESARLTFAAFLKHSINAPAVAGSAILTANNAAATVISSLKAVQTGTAGFAKFDGTLAPFKESFETVSSGLQAKLENLENK